MIKRPMTIEEEDRYWNVMVAQITDYDPDEIIGIGRSGCALAQWVAETLDLPLGFLDFKSKQFVCQFKSRRLVFVDDNCGSGQTYLQLREWFTEYFPHLEMKLAVFFSDAERTPVEIQNEIIQGGCIDFYANGPLYSSLKQLKGLYIRRRDELRIKNEI